MVEIPTPLACQPSPALATIIGPEIVLKPRYGFGSRDVVVPSSSKFDPNAYSDESYIAQERCSEPEVTVDAFVLRRLSTERAPCRERLEVKVGVCTKARIFENKDLSDLGLSVGRQRRIHGSFCIHVVAKAPTNSTERCRPWGAVGPTHVVPLPPFLK
jgi:hypothetical protein